MGLLEPTYEVPSSGESSFFKLAPGENRFRIIDSPKMGYQYFEESKCIKISKASEAADGAEDVKHYWELPIWHSNRVKVLTITQKTIQEALSLLDVSTDWGALNEYDVIITRSGERMETKYQVTPCPKKPLSAEVKKAFAEFSKTTDWSDEAPVKQADDEDELPF